MTIVNNAESCNPWFWDLSDPISFINQITGNLNATFQTFPERNGAEGRSKIYHGSFAELVDELYMANHKGHGVFMMINEGDGRGRRSENVLSVRSLFVDLDGAPVDPCQQGPLEPHIIIETSPRRYHVYWKVEGVELRHFTFIQRQLAAKFHGDPSVCDLPRVMRLPGSHHKKNERAFACRIIASSNSDPYTLEEFINAFEIDFTTVEHPAAVVSQSESESTCIRESGRNTHLTSVAGRMRRNGSSHQVIEAALVAENQDRCSPPLPTEEVVSIARSVSRYEPSDRQYQLTHLGNAERLLQQHGSDLKFCPQLHQWFVWQFGRWVLDDNGEVMRRLKEVVRLIGAQAEAISDSTQRRAMLSHAKRSEQTPHLESTLKSAQTEAVVLVNHEDFDSDPFLLNVVNGTIDLRTGDLRQHNREDLVTKLCPVEYRPDSESPHWLRFLHRIMDGCESRIAYLQRVLGYSLTGDTSEQCWFFLHGYGANGKSTLVNTVQYILGSYGAQTPPETFLENKFGSIRNDLARLRGIRFVNTSEPCQFKSLDEGNLKTFTGGDRIVCRELYKEYIEYTPSGKLFLSANHRPDVKAVDNGFWRRVQLIPFEVRIPESEQDRRLSHCLKEEAAGILAWMVRGCLEWGQQGLNPPSEITSAVTDYREESDPLAEFISEECEIRDGLETSASQLYEAYCEHCGEQKPMSQKRFGTLLSQRGLAKAQRGNSRQRTWEGIGLREADQDCFDDYL